MAARCKAKTTSGARCKRKSRPGAARLCELHGAKAKRDPKRGGRKRCQGVTADGAPCTNKAVAGGYCGRHRNQIDDPEAWQRHSETEIERRKQFALMRRRELEVAQEEERLVDAGVARTESARIAALIQETWATVPARRSHEIAAELGVPTGKVAAVLEKVIRIELKEIADSL